MIGQTQKISKRELRAANHRDREETEFHETDRSTTAAEDRALVRVLRSQRKERRAVLSRNARAAVSY